MNRSIILGIALAIALVGPASGSTFRYLDPAVASPRVVAGEIDANGNVVRGSGFTVAHPSPGQYEIRFVNNSLRGCGAMTVTPVIRFSYADVLGQSSQPNCGRKYHVAIYEISQQRYVDDPFQFVAVEELPP